MAYGFGHRCEARLTLLGVLLDVKHSIHVDHQGREVKVSS
jgi:hypothetical protein